jgi:hypothetical protein
MTSFINKGFVTRRFKIACSAKKLFGKGGVVEFFIFVKKVNKFLKNLQERSPKLRRIEKE